MVFFHANLHERSLLLCKLHNSNFYRVICKRAVCIAVCYRATCNIGVCCHAVCTIVNSYHASNFLFCKLQDWNFLSCNLQESGLLSCNLQDTNLLSCNWKDRKVPIVQLAIKQFATVQFVGRFGILELRNRVIKPRYAK